MFNTELHVFENFCLQFLCKTQSSIVTVNTFLKGENKQF